MVKTKDILVLFSYRNHKYGYIEMLFERLSTKANNRSLALFRGSLNDLHILVKDNALSITESLTDRDVRSFDGIYFELWYKSQQQALAVAHYAKRHAIPFFSEELLTLPAMTKVGEIAVLADNTIPIPNTFISSRRELKKFFKSKKAPLSFPLIVKAADGYGGKNNHLVHDYGQLKAILDEHKHIQFVVQEFIPNDCDYRCLVFGGDVKLVLQRTRGSDVDTHLNNTSQGAEGKVVPVDTLGEDVRADVVAAAKLLGRGAFAGVDLIINTETGAHSILEVNQTPQIEIGAAVDEKMDALLNYMEEMSGADHE